MIPIPLEEVCALDDVDRVLERAARRNGGMRATGSGVCVRLHGPTQMSSAFRHPIGASCKF